ncbi:NAD(P)H-binding protein [bacterium]|nr:NAD(P)H-binding protein [bacterium]
MSIELIEGKLIFLTGGTSHTGRRLAARLVERGARLRCLLHNPTHRGRLPDHPGVEIVQGSAESVDDLRRGAEGADTVIHLAHIRYGEQVVQALANRDRPARLIVTSSTRLLSRFPSESQQAVRQGEAAIQNAPWHIQWTILRPAMIFGGRDDNNIERLGRLIRKMPIFPLFSLGHSLVQPLYVWDLVDAIVACVERPEAVGQTYVLAGPKPIPYGEMVRQIAKAMGKRPPLCVPVPRAPSILFARLLKALWSGSPVDPDFIRRFGENRTFDISKARQELAFSPTPFEEAVQKKYREQI